MKRNFFFHFRPRTVPPQSLLFSLTWGLGGAATLMVVMQLLTGLLLNFFYQPLPVQAYLSVQNIQNSVFLGRLLRNLHHWTGHALVVVVFLHLLRILIQDAFSPPRQWNWLLGICLGVLILLENFSGYLLPWDQLAYWAVTIATSMLDYIPLAGNALQNAVRGGSEVGAPTLQIFAAVHTTLVPVLIFFLMGCHFWNVRRNGGVLLRRESCETSGVVQQNVPAIPELLTREIAFAMVILCVLLLFSMSVDAPLTAMANPDLTPDTVRAPWYFVGVQELLLHVPALLAAFVIPLVVIMLLVFLPFLSGRNTQFASVIKNILYCALVLFAGLTITGIWFRGPGMKLVWPW